MIGVRNVKDEFELWLIIVDGMNVFHHKYAFKYVSSYFFMDNNIQTTKKKKNLKSPQLMGICKTSSFSSNLFFFSS